MTKKFKKNRAFSLLEFVVYIGVLIILISVITLFSATLIKSLNKNRIKKEVNQGAYMAMKTMLYEIRAAKTVYVPTSKFNVHPGQLSLETSKDVPSGEIKTYVDFYVDENSRLYFKKEGREPILILSENLRVSDLEFEYLSSISESVKINLIVGYNTANPEYQYLYRLTSSATVRK